MKRAFELKNKTSKNVAYTTFKGESQLLLHPTKRIIECSNLESLEICSMLTLKTPEQHQ